MAAHAAPPADPGTPGEVVAFWGDVGAAAWFRKNPALDLQIRQRFEPLHHAAARGEHDGWAGDPEGSLALLLLLDQFPRNIWRGSAHAFATDGKARAIARAAIAAGHDGRTDLALRPFYYLPLEHSEALADQDLAVALCDALRPDPADSAKWARLHRDIIARFGRFPHRNACLGRATTPEEQAFLDEGGFAG